MSSPFLAEIRIFAGNFAPRGYAFCDGQILPISQNTALFSLLGTTYGGDGKSNFALPNLQGMAPLQQGQGPGLSFRQLGETAGETAVTLLANQIASHTHELEGSTNGGDQSTPTSTVLAESKKQKLATKLYASSAGTSPATGAILEPGGGAVPHNNLPPYLTLNFIIALTGVFPSRP
ncbi:MAG TPA: tail fiber protein [Acidimicrobiales bacterium]|jgi:microcystin-dependent protein|nr:tail fiber protein [Acidimicrobiales bacterium]